MAEQLSIGALAIAFVAGLASFFSPCVAPLVPGYIGFLSGASLRTGQVGGTGAAVAVARKPYAATLLFVGGFSTAFIALGIVSAGAGQLLAAYLPVMQTLAGIVMIAMGAFLLGLLPRAAMATLLRERRVSLNPAAMRALGVAGPFVFGVVFAAGWTPCIGPVLASILAYAGAGQSAGTGAALLAIYSLGFALPFLAVGLGWSVGLRALGWAKRHGRAVELVSGAALVLVGLLYLTGEVSAISAWAQHLNLFRGLTYAPGRAG